MPALPLSPIPSPRLATRELTRLDPGQLNNAECSLQIDDYLASGAHVESVSQPISQKVYGKGRNQEE
jgi:hypothetical protein